MHRFLIRGGLFAGAEVRFDEREARHAFRVLRLRPGARVQLTDGLGKLFWGELTREGARVLGVCDASEPPIRLTLYQGLPKFEKLELVSQKATELGFSRVIPVKMKRTLVRLDAREGEKRRERVERICREAAKQCGRGTAPEVLAPVDFEEAVSLMETENLAVVAWEEEKDLTLTDLRAMCPDAKAIGLVIGPEGGIAREEADRLKAAGARAVTLGPRILRTETAAIAAGAVIMNLWGDL